MGTPFAANAARVAGLELNAERTREMPNAFFWALISIACTFMSKLMITRCLSLITVTLWTLRTRLTIAARLLDEIIAEVARLKLYSVSWACGLPAEIPKNNGRTRSNFVMFRIAGFHSA